MRREYKRFFWVWVGLMVLLALTFGSAYLPMGIWNSVTNLVIAIIKAALVALFFMQLRGARGAIRICAVIALFTLALLFAISTSDYATRVIHRAPWQTPVRVAAIALTETAVTRAMHER